MPKGMKRVGWVACFTESPDFFTSDVCAYKYQLSHRWGRVKSAKVIPVYIDERDLKGGRR